MKQDAVHDVESPDLEQQRRRYQVYVRQFFEELPLHPPKKMYEMLSRHHYKGQKQARKALTLMAYRHVRRLKRIHLDGIARDHLPPKTNYLMIGPTGCGKTFLVELLFQKILQIPTTIVDVTQLSETGYVGNDTCTILTTLLQSTGNEPAVASAGIICLDEFDKLATTQNTARFDGQGTTKDVSGFGVQRELLRIIEGVEVAVPLDLNNTMYSQRLPLRTEDISFIACGTFSGFKGITQDQSGNIGFTALPEIVQGKREQTIAVKLEDQEVNNIENFQVYGFIPELMGRFTRIMTLDPLDRDTLKSILMDSVVRKFVREFKEEGITFKIEKRVLHSVVEQSFKRQTGARGLASILTHHIEDAAFESFCNNVKSVTLRMRGKNIVSELE